MEREFGFLKASRLPDGRVRYTCGCAGADTDQVMFRLDEDGNIPEWLEKLGAEFILCPDCSARLDAAPGKLVKESFVNP